MYRCKTPTKTRRRDSKKQTPSLLCKYWPTDKTQDKFSFNMEAPWLPKIRNTVRKNVRTQTSDRVRTV